MEIEVTASFVGPNIYSLNPALSIALRKLETLPAADLSACYAAACGALPSLSSIVCEMGAPQCFHNGDIELNHLFEHICIALQNSSGAELQCARSPASATASKGEAIVPYEEFKVCEEAAKIASHWLNSSAEPNTIAAAYGADVDTFQDFSQRYNLPVQDRVLMRSAKAASVPAFRLMGRILQLGHGIHQQRLSATKTTLTNVVSNDIATNKDYARKIFEELGLPSPIYARVYRSRDAVAAAKRIGFPVVVKPNSGNTGKGISIGLNSSSEVRAAYKLARQYGRSVLVEQLIKGADYRILVIGGELCAAAMRVPAHVIGDGQHNIEALVEKVNSDPQRGVGARFSWTLIALDERADQLLEAQGHTRQSVPAQGENIYLRRNANTSDGGTAVDVTDQVHPHNREIAVLAARAMGLDIAGVDLLIPDISQSIWGPAGGAICEVNSRPGMRKHMWPAKGKPRDVTGPILNMLFPPTASSRVPIVVVSGSGDRRRVVNLLANIFTQRYQHVGLVSAGHARVCGSAVHRGPLTLPQASRALLLDPRTEILVIDASPEEVMAQGLQHDQADIAIVVEQGSSAAPAADCLQAVGVIARTTRKHIVTDRAPRYDTGEALLHRLDKTSLSNPEQALNIKKTVGGTATQIRFGKQATINLDSALRASLPVGDDRYTPHACLGALLLGIEAEVIERGLSNYIDYLHTNADSNSATEVNNNVSNEQG